MENRTVSRCSCISFSACAASLVYLLITQDPFIILKLKTGLLRLLVLLPGDFILPFLSGYQAEGGIRTMADRAYLIEKRRIRWIYYFRKG